MQPIDSLVATAASSWSQGANRRARGALLSACMVVVVASAAFDWLQIKTQRLDLGQKAADRHHSGSVSRRFMKNGDQVAPAIRDSDESSFSFPLHLSLPHKLRFTAVPENQCAFEVNLITHERKRQLLSATIAQVSAHSVWLPAVDGSLQFVARGRINWVDTRVSRSFFLWPFYGVALLGLAATAWRSRSSIAFLPRTANWLTLAASVVICLGLVEILLRSVASKLPAAVLMARHDLGLISAEPDWVDSPRYKRRHRPNSQAVYEWRWGDLVRTGLIAQNLIPGMLRRFPVQIDAEGFRNARVREKIEIAALGDSFTDAVMLPVEQAWPARLEKLTGRAVQNYGTSGYGPQEELYVLQDYAIKHRPRIVVLGFFAGNDLLDSIKVNWQQRSGLVRAPTWSREMMSEGKIPEFFHNYETLYLWSIGKVAAQRMWRRTTPPPRNEPPAKQAYFAEGVFHIPVREHILHFACTPPHLFELSATRSDLEQSRSWNFARSALLEMNSTCARNGARLVLMFIPSQPEVYWPLTERSIPRAELERALDFYLSAWNRLRPPNEKRRSPKVGLLRTMFPSSNEDRPNADQISANRLAQNEMLADFCTRENIPMLDLTAALQEKAASGTAVYLPDDAHWNETGHEVAANELARFLKQLL